MGDIYHEDIKSTVLNGDVASKIREVLDVHNPRQGWKVGRIAYYPSQRETELRIPLTKYDDPLEESVDTFTLNKALVEDRLKILPQEGYTDFQTIPSGENVIIVATKPYTKKYGQR